MKNIFLYLIVLSLMIIGYQQLFAGKNDRTKEEKIKAILEDVNLAPDFSLSSINDSTYTLSELKGKVVILNFWATWCGPCIMEIPDFNELYKKHSRDDLEILSISISDTKKALNNFVKVRPIHYPVLFGSQKNIDKILMEYGGVYAVPTSILIGKKGNVLKTYPGALLKGYPIFTAFLQDLALALYEK